MVRLTRRGSGVGLETKEGAIEARRALLASGATRGLVPAIRRRIVPVYDYVLVTEPLTREQLASIGWANRQGLSDSSNQFHYYRLTQDDRILFGGFDAVYHYGNGKRPSSSRASEAPRGWRLTSSPSSRSSKASASRIGGAGRSTPAAASSPSMEPPIAARSPTRSDTPGSASARAGSGPALRWTCSRVARANPEGSARSAAGPGRFPPSPCAGRSSP